jgi:tRNA threonylcarbamoyladenosine biosynthesis protein TsaB
MGATKIILSLETATLGGSVFLGRGDVELATGIGNPGVSHSNSLLSDINESLNEAGLPLQGVEVFACASGPGSFTGLRIGIATVKALAATLNRPCVGIPTLHAVAHSAGPSEATVALLPAGRGELFAQMFTVSEDKTVAELDAAAHLSPQKLLERYGALKNLTWAGPGAYAERNFLAGIAEEQGIHFRDEVGHHDSKREPGWTLATKAGNLARHVAILALRDLETGRIQSPQSLSAIYVRPSDAELKQQCR